MGCVSYLCRIITFSAQFFLVIFTVANIVNFLPDSVKFTEYHSQRPQPLTGKLALNTLLNNAERLFENEIKGPEGFAVLNGELYTSLHGGYVAKLKNNKIVPVVKFGQHCEHWWEEEKCGRPLGMATTADGHLVVADAYYGIWTYHPGTGKKTVLVEKNAQIEEKPSKIFNSVAVGKDNTVYWTHSSSDFELFDGLYTMLADPSGRLMMYSPVTKKNTVLLDKLHFANGVTLSEDEEFALVCETGIGRVKRVYLKGPKKSQSDIFIDGLPGLPDNIRPNGKGGFFVALTFPRDEDNPALIDYIGHIPFARRILARLLAMGDWYAKGIHKLYPNYYTQRLIHIIGHFEMLYPFHPSRVTLLEVDNKGQILKSYYGLDGSVKGLSDVIPYDGYLYMGSPYTTFLGRVKLSKLGITDKSKRLQ